jgi:hypothetical protein
MSTYNPQLFAEYMVSVVKDEAKLKAFNEAVKDAGGLQQYAAANGFELPDGEADRIFASASAFAASPQAQKLNDETLDGIAGGIDWAGVGGIVGGVAGTAGVAIGVLAFLAAAPFTGGGSIVGAAMLLSSTAATGLVVASAAGGAVGAGIGALGGELIEQSLKES